MRQIIRDALLDGHVVTDTEVASSRLQVLGVDGTFNLVAVKLNGLSSHEEVEEWTSFMLEPETALTLAQRLVDAIYQFDE